MVKRIALVRDEVIEVEQASSDKEQYYIDQLKKVIKAYRHDWRKTSYIKQAINDLRAVRNGRMW